MRLDRLYIEDFKNLKQFHIDFDETEMTTVLIGRNGTGKSNLIEAIVTIFRDLDLSRAPSFSYNLTYICQNHNVNIQADCHKKQHTVITIDGEKISFTEFTQRSARAYLPKYVFSYYSGPSNRLESLFDIHQKRFYDDLLHGKEKPLRPLFYARPIHSQFVLLSFFLYADDVSKQFLDDFIGISGIESVTFNFKEPRWKSSYGDERFWNARGVVANFLSELYKHSSSPVRTKETAKIGFRRTRKEEHLYLRIDGESKLKRLTEICSSNTEFFKMLESTYISEILQGVEIKVRLKGNENTLTFWELSEGEQQLINVFGLLRFTKDEESLFLLDEPDTHLNPAWKQVYLDLLERIFGKHDTTHIIVCTHDPLVISGLTRSQVQIFEREAETGKIHTRIPEKDPKGMGVAGLLTSELFGLRTTLDTRTESKLDRKRELLVKSHETKLTAEEEEEMEQLSNELENLGFTRTIRDPLYEKFVIATMAVDEFKKPVLTPADKKRQDEIAKQIIEQILEEERKSGL